MLPDPEPLLALPPGERYKLILQAVAETLSWGADLMRDVPSCADALLSQSQEWAQAEAARPRRRAAERPPRVPLRLVP